MSTVHRRIISFDALLGNELPSNDHPDLATIIPVALSSVSRAVRSAQARYLQRVRNTFTSTVVVPGVSAEATRSCGSRPTTMGSREWISSRRTMVPQPRARNRFTLLPRFGSYANLFLPVGDDTSDTRGHSRISLPPCK